MTRPAVIDPSGAWSRSQILTGATALGDALDTVDHGSNDGDRNDDGGTGRLTGIQVGPRVALLCEPGHDFLVALFGCWEAGMVAVPLHPAHPPAELAPLAADAGITAIVCSSAHRGLADHLARSRADLGEVAAVIDVQDHLAALPDDPRRGVPGDPASTRARSASSTGLPEHPADRGALMVFTSGTTGRPKGVLHTHGSIGAQVDALLGPWGWTADDRSLLVLPLHHVHGIMAVVLCSWAAGATCEAPGRFDPVATWERFASGQVTVFMAVPTIYARLIRAWEEADAEVRRRWSDGARSLRLMVSGSAALPVSVLDRWRELSGHVLLERYGMTEFGLALSNSLTHRVPGHVGWPLPGFEVRRLPDDGGTGNDDEEPTTADAHLDDDEPGDLGALADDEPGELVVRGPAMFRAYWNRPDNTAASFTADGWFRTGDVGVVDPEGHRLLGRSSVDIIKTGGEKVSAVEIEEIFRRHPSILDAAVVGLPDDEWGQRVALMAIATPDADDDDLHPEALRAWGKERLAPAKVPVRFLAVDDLPRNAMGKVTKAAVVDRFLDVHASDAHASDAHTSDAHRSAAEAPGVGGGPGVPGPVV